MTERRLVGLYCISHVHLCDGKALLGTGHLESVLYHETQFCVNHFYTKDKVGVLFDMRSRSNLIALLLC